MNFTKLCNVYSEVAEGPIWNKKESTITWVDITGKKWHRLSLITNELITHSVSGMIGAIIERSTSGYIAAVEEGFATIEIGKNGYELIHDFLPKNERMNDAKVDFKGRLWAGSTAINFEKGKGKLHKLERDGKLTTLIEGLILPNGLGWSPDNKYFYLVDTFARKIYRYEFDLESGSLKNGHDFFEFPDDSSYPDGLTVASDGTVLVAMWNGGRIEVISQEGKKVNSISLPIKKPTSCTFGGLDGEILIVTSDGRDWNKYENSNDGLIFSLEGTGFFGPESEKYSA